MLQAPLHRSGPRCGSTPGDEDGTLRKPLYLGLQAALLTLAAFVLALHYVHLSADFPNFSPWMDWSKYTDEGWYGDAAIRHFQLGHWNVPGTFNPGAALPVWPLLEGIVFYFAGVSLVAARALTVTVFAATLIASWFLVRRSGKYPGASASGADARSGLCASAAVLLLVFSPFCYVFTRLAILEPLLALLMLLTLLVASSVRAVPGGSWHEIACNGRQIAALGVLLPMMVLTKTTAVFLLPAAAWMLFATLGYRWSSWLRVGCSAALLGLALWMVYFFGVVRPYYLEDYRYLFSANAYTFVTAATFWSVVHDMLKGGLWLGKAIYLSAAACILFALLLARRLRSHPLIVALLLWIGGYASFLVYHNNLQPRYYYLLAIPLTLLVPLVMTQSLLPSLHTARARQLAAVCMGLLLLAIVVPDARQTLGYVRHPQYTFVHAAAEIRSTIDSAEQRDPKHSRLLLSISGSDLSLMTGLPSICDDFSVLELEEEVKRYNPGWYVAWNQLEDDKMDALSPHYQITRVASFPAMDDPDRNLLIVYRLDPAPPRSEKKHQRKLTPRQLRTRLGQQPSTSQLEH